MAAISNVYILIEMDWVDVYDGNQGNRVNTVNLSVYVSKMGIESVSNEDQAKFPFSPLNQAK